MSKLRVDRRSGKDRRRGHLSPQKGPDMRAADRRQFPPAPGEPDSLAPEARALKDAIDTYKQSRGLPRITLPQLLSILAKLR